MTEQRNTRKEPPISALEVKMLLRLKEEMDTCDRLALNIQRMLRWQILRDLPASYYR